VAAALLVVLWRLLSRDPAAEAGSAVVGGSDWSPWRSISEVLRPHTTWLLLLATICILLMRQSSYPLVGIWKGSPTLQRPYTIIVSDDGITFAEPLAHHELKWFAFDRVIESQNLFLLYITDHSFHMVPKRALADGRQVDEFRAMIDNRITRRPTAFPVLPVAG
jgi:hypothetical protein